MGLLGKYRYPLILLLLILCALAFLCYRINDPFVGGYQSYSTIYNLIAKNYLRYGYLNTKFGWVINSDLVSPEQFIYYTRHPPLFSFILSSGIRIFGDYEWSARVVLILFSLCNIILIYLIARELWGRFLGIVASFFAALSPINCFYGSHIDHVGSVVLFFMFTTFFFYVLWFKRQNNCYFFSMCIFFLLGALTAWPAYFLVPFLLVHNLLTRKSPIIWVLPLIAALIFISFLSYIHMLTGNWLGGQIKEMFLYRMGISGIHPQWTEIGYLLPECPGLNFTFGKFFVKLAYKMALLFSPVLVFFSAIWMVDFVARIIRKKEMGNDLLLLIFFLGCGSYCFVFPKVTFQHEYVLLCLWGPVAISSGLGFNIIKNKLSWPKYFQQTSFICIGILLLAQTSLVTYEKGRRRTKNSLWEYTLGKTIGQHVLPGEEVITSSPISFAARYYADKFIRFEVRDLENFISLKNDPGRNYRYFVVKSDDPIGPGLWRYLETNYPSHREKGLIFFKLC